jgi:6-phosphogluconolactonase (cycloisomerase 2 family)
MTAFRRRTVVSLAAAALAGAALPAVARSYDDDGFRSGMVFSITTAASGNELLAYARGQNGELHLQARIATGGQGSGDDLASQGAVTLSGDGRFLFAVNGLSNSVSTFAIESRALRLISVAASGGIRPISVAEYDGLVYVLNDGGSGNVSGFRNVSGELRPVADGVRGLSVAGGAGSAQVGFSADGRVLLVSEKNTDALTSYRVDGDGKLGTPLVTHSAGQTPFGFAFDRHNRLIVSEAAGGAAGASTTSSYRFDPADPVRPVVISAAVPNGQAAACWVAITPDGHFAFVTNAASGTISSYRIEQTGAIKLIDAAAGLTPNGAAGDASLSRDGRQLYVINLLAGGIFTFTVGFDGSLTPGANITGLPPTTQGLAAN